MRRARVALDGPAQSLTHRGRAMRDDRWGSLIAGPFATLFCPWPGPPQKLLVAVRPELGSGSRAEGARAVQASWHPDVRPGRRPAPGNSAPQLTVSLFGCRGRFSAPA